MLCLEIQSSQQMIALYTMIQQLRLNMLKICQWWNGRGLKKYHLTKILRCKLIQRVQEILSKDFLVSMIAGSSDHF